MVVLALLPEPRPKARNLPTRYGARDVGAQANRIRLAGPALRCFEPGAAGGRHEQEFRQAEEAAEEETATNAQGAPEREACGQEAQLRLLSPGRQIETRGQGRLR
jgi:hypothetical protein